MAITDNSFTADELKSALTENKDLATALQSGGYFIRTKEEDENLRTTLEGDYTKLVKTTTGIEPADKESPSAYAARVLKTTHEERKQFAKELEELKKQSNITDYERQQIKDMQKLIADKDGEIETIKTNSLNEVSKAKLENSVIGQMNSVTSKLVKDTRAGVNKAIELMNSTILGDIMTMAQKDSRGVIILVNGEKTALTNKDGSFTTVAQYYEEKMNEAGFVDNGKQQQGAGGTDPSGQITSVPGNCKTQVELMEFLREGPMKGKSQQELIKEFDKYAHLLTR